MELLAAALLSHAMSELTHVKPLATLQAAAPSVASRHAMVGSALGT
jgi:hypothetical protein